MKKMTQEQVEDFAVRFLAAISSEALHQDKDLMKVLFRDFLKDPEAFEHKFNLKT